MDVGVVSETPSGPPGSTAGADGTVSGSHVYGDDGDYTVTVCVTDDDGGVGCNSFLVSVNNVDPTAEIDLSETILINGVPTFLAHAGDPVGFNARSTDPGSDDLDFIWGWGTGRRRAD